MSYKAGDKFIIELGTEIRIQPGDEKLWRIKGFNTLVFDETGLSRLEKYEGQEKNKVLRAGAEVICEDGEHGVILGFGQDEWYQRIAYILWYDGSCSDAEVRYLTPTGKFFLEVDRLKDVMLKNDAVISDSMPWDEDEVG